MTYFHHDGQLWRRSEGFPNGCFLDREVAERLIPHHRSDPCTAVLADQLENAMREQDQYHEHQEAA